MEVIESGPQGRLSITNKGRYACNGVQCHHYTSSDWRNIDWSSRVHEPKFDELDFSCVALSQMSMCIYKPFSLIFCVKCKMLLDLNGLHIHITNAHTGILPWTRPGGVNKYTLLIAHLKDQLGLPETFIPPPWLVAHRPIPLLPQPKLYARCPNPECGMSWAACHKGTAAAVKKRLNNHLKTRDACNGSDETVRLKTQANWTPEQCRFEQETPVDHWKSFLAATQAYAQVAYPGKNGENRLVVYCPNGWTPQAPRLSTTNTGRSVADRDQEPEMPINLLDVVDQSYAEDLGWNALFKTTLGKQLPINDWKMLLTPFDEDEHESEEQCKTTEALERGIAEVRAFLYEYLESANFCAKSYSEIFRQQLTPSNG